MLLGLLLAAPPRAAEPPPDRELFERHELSTGFAESQTVLSGFLIGGPVADLAVISVDPDNRRRLKIFQFSDGQWVPAIEGTLRPEVQFIDLADIGGRDRLITYGEGQLSWFDPESESEQELLALGARYRAADRSRVPHVDITRDLNLDGRDDLVLPDVEGFWISTQLSDGSFGEAMMLGPTEPFADSTIGNLDVNEPASESPRTYGDVGVTEMTVPVYLSRIHQMDRNLDGRSDLLFWNQDRFDVHLQETNGRFSTDPESFAPTVAIDSDGAYSRAFDYRDQGVMPMIFGYGKKTSRTVLHSLRDVNGDSIADLVTLTLSGKTLTKQRSLFAVHFGSATPDGVRFASEASTAIRASGKAGGMQPWGYSSQWFEDLDDNGQLEIVLRDVNVGLGGMGQALLGRSVPINLELYRAEEGLYPDRPATTRKIRRFAPLGKPGGIFFPPVLLGDVNGDGLADLLVGESPRELHVFLGQIGPGLLAEQPLTVEVALPNDERNTRLVDLNGDGRQDVLVLHPPKDDEPTKSLRVTTLIARAPSG